MVRSTRTRFRQFIDSPWIPEVGLSHTTRRAFLAASGKFAVMGGLASCLPRTLSADDKVGSPPWTSPFRVAVITDEISQDFEHACFIAAREFGMQWVEVRGLWNKNLMNLSAARNHAGTVDPEEISACG